MSASVQALEYLESLPGMVFTRLYQQPSTALAVFRRMLPHSAKAIVMAMLYMTSPFRDADLLSWIRPEAKPEKEQAISILERLHILKAVDSKGFRAYRLATNFGQSLRQALTGGGTKSSFGVPCDTPDKEGVDIEFLDTFARSRWEAILYYMVGSAGAGLGGDTPIANGTKQLLAEGSFVMMKGSHPVITQDGFTFLLQDVNAQVWRLMIVYLEGTDERHMDHVDVLSFLFTLGSLELGQDYSTENLTATQRTFLDDLTDLGIVYMSEPSRFYPTRLATTLTSDAGALLSSSSFASDLPANSTASKGYIIVETNYRLYAYTSSVLQIAILNLFANLNRRFPNLVSGKLTKTSIQRAISYGITAEQIISYLTTHAHPQMQKSKQILPPTVVDQIRLWQIEGDRMTATNGFFMKDFRDFAEYEDAMKYADALGVLVWKSDAKRWFFVNKLEQMQTYFSNKKQDQNAG